MLVGYSGEGTITCTPGIPHCNSRSPYTRHKPGTRRDPFPYWSTSLSCHISGARPTGAGIPPANTRDRAGSRRFERGQDNRWPIMSLRMYVDRSKTSLTIEIGNRLSARQPLFERMKDLLGIFTCPNILIITHLFVFAAVNRHSLLNLQSPSTR